MEPADRKRFSSILSKFGCLLYDPQQGVRFDKLHAFLVDEAGEHKALVEENVSRLLPRLEILTRTVTWDEYLQQSKTRKHIQYNAVIHRAKTVTKAASFMRFGRAWTNRSCQCKTAQPAGEEQGRRCLEDLFKKIHGPRGG